MQQSKGEMHISCIAAKLLLYFEHRCARTASALQQQRNGICHMAQASLSEQAAEGNTFISTTKLAVKEGASKS